MTFTETLLFSLAAALLSLDQMACFQMLLSRPILTALILGALFGNLTDAALVGVCLELLFVRTISVKERASADPTLATAAALGGIWGVSTALHPLALEPFAAALGLLASFLSKWFDVRLRNVNVTLSHVLHHAGMIQLTAAAALLAKSFGFYFLTILAVQGALPKIVAALGAHAPAAGVFAWLALVPVCLGHASATLQQTVPRGVWL